RGVATARGAYPGPLFATTRMRMRADGLDPVDDGLDFALRRRLLHDDHHLECLPGYALNTIRVRSCRGRFRPFNGARPVGPFADGSFSSDEAGRAPSQIARRRDRHKAKPRKTRRPWGGR